MNNITNLETKSTNQISQQTNTGSLIFNTNAMIQMQNMAELMAQGKATMPKHLQNAPADCLAIVMQAAQWQMNPFAVAQKTHLVNGTLGYEAQLVNAVISSSAAINGRFKYEYQGQWPNGQDAAVRCGAVLRGESEITWGAWLYPAAVTTKNSPLWKTAPQQQASYLALKYWSRLFTPDVILGVYTPDELNNGIPAEGERDITPVSGSETLNSIIQEVNQEEAKPAVPAAEGVLVDDNGEEDPAVTVKRYLDKLDSVDSLDLLKATFADSWGWAKDNNQGAAAAEFKATYDSRLLEF